MHHDWSEQVHYISIKHARYITQVHCRDNTYSLHHQYERMQFTIHFIKEIKKLIPLALLSYKSSSDFLKNT